MPGRASISPPSSRLLRTSRTRWRGCGNSIASPLAHQRHGQSISTRSSRKWWSDPAKWRDEPQRLGVTITVHTALQEEGLPPILGVESELREALINLIFNAVDAMPQGGNLTLQTRAIPTAVVVEVIDTGIGYGRDHATACLEPFYTTKTHGGRAWDSLWCMG